MKANGWTPERRKRQSEMIKQWKPWKKSTGPRSESGKEAVKMNALKHGMYGSEWKSLKKQISDQKKFLKEFHKLREL